jgi:hypothetical protein
MIVQILSCGVHWWGLHAGELEDPFRFRRNPVYFNTSGLMYGRRLRDCHIYRGQLRFNRTSGFDPEFVERLPGKTFETAAPLMYEGRVRLLFQFPAMDQEPDMYLVTLHLETHGAIQFNRNGWKSPGVRPIAISKHHERYEAMLLMEPGQWVASDRGRWEMSPATRQLALQGQESAKYAL